MPNVMTELSEKKVSSFSSPHFPMLIKLSAD